LDKLETEAALTPKLTTQKPAAHVVAAGAAELVPAGQK